MKTEKGWLNVSEAAKYLQVSRETIYKLMEQGVLPYTKIRGLQRRRIKKEDLQALFERFEVNDKKSAGKKSGR